MSGPNTVLKDFVLTHTLGSGRRSEVILAENGVEKLAIKCIKKTGKPSYDARGYRNYLSEVGILSGLKHPNVISLEAHGDVVIYDAQLRAMIPCYCMVLKCAEAGDLHDFIKNTGIFSYRLARYYFCQVLNAVEYIHKAGFVHRDIKPRNILLDKFLTALLADFDLATPASESLQSLAGTYGHMAPEVEMGEKYSGMKADIFSLGVTLFYMVVGRYPFNGTYHNVHYETFCCHNSSFWGVFESINGDYDREFKDLVGLMLAKNPDKRPTISAIKEHPWFNQAEIPELELSLEKILRKEKIGL